jgi:hypothetical protein
MAAGRREQAGEQIGKQTGEQTGEQTGKQAPHRAMPRRHMNDAGTTSWR